jgi:glycosyltransferase involved in cell wall biosynthesis
VPADFFCLQPIPHSVTPQLWFPDLIRWAIITGEYPPQTGGVSDYTRLVAEGLTHDGDAVTVYAPFCSEPDPAHGTATIRRLPDHFGIRGLAALDTLLRTDPVPDRILIQYVPHAYGFKAMNLPFAVWVGTRAKRIAPVWVMFHEVCVWWVWRPVKHAFLSAMTMAMAKMIAGSAERVFINTPLWEPLLRRICPRIAQPEWLPVPCNIAMGASEAQVADVRGKYALDQEAILVGHFGTYGDLITALLEPIVTAILASNSAVIFLLIGQNSDTYRTRFIAAHHEWEARVCATGALETTDVTIHLLACDLLIQPYPDGVSARRTSVMAGLANGVPLVTNLGQASELVWAGSGIPLATEPDPIAIAELASELLTKPSTEARDEIGRRGALLYQNLFALEHTIDKLREPWANRGGG